MNRDAGEPARPPGGGALVPRCGSSSSMVRQGVTRGYESGIGLGFAGMLIWLPPWVSLTRRPQPPSACKTIGRLPDTTTPQAVILTRTSGATPTASSRPADPDRLWALSER